MILNTKVLALFAVAASAVGASNAATFATFGDPSTGTPPLFDINTTTDTFTAGWSGTGLTLNLPYMSATYNDAKFSTAVPISFAPAGPYATTGGGEIDFTDALDNVIFRINFDSGFLSATGFGASEFTGSNVSFSGPGIPATVNDQFAFSFANIDANESGATATAAFTSSASPVPEPVSMTAIAIGLAGILARRRKA